MVLLLLIWGMNGVSKLTIATTIVFLIALLTFAWVSFFSYDAKQQKLNVLADSKNKSHLISHIVRKIEQRDFEKLAHEAYEANLHCYECLIVKTPQMYHCKVCSCCVDVQHKHSNFFGKCIGRDNAIAYFWFLSSTLALNATLLACLINCISHKSDGEGSDQEASSSMLRIVSSFVTVYEQNLLFLGLALAFVWFQILKSFEKLLQLSLAIANCTTVRELSDLWMHTHLFKIEREDIADPLQMVQ